MLVNKSDKPIMAKSYYRVVRLLMLAFAAQLGQGSDPVTDPLRGVLPVKKQSPRNPLRPHIILIVLDDLGWDDVSLHGSPQIDTPNIDRLAKEGVLLENYYTQPLCTPSRGALMTGMYPAHLGLQHDVIKGPEPWGLPTKFKIMPQYLNEAGYESHIVGKWHLGHSRSELLPTRRGFKTHFGCRLGRTDYFDHWSTGKNFAGLDLWSNESPEKGYYGIYGTDLFTNRAIGILENHNKSIPLFLYLAHQSVHVGGGVQPLQVPAPLVGLYDTKIIHDKRRHYAPMVLAADKSIETFMNAMKKYGFDNNSIVIFTNDNGGPANGMHGGGSSNYPLRGSKYTLWEGGIRGTAAIWAPQLLQPKKYTGLTHISDFLPTLLEALDLPIPQGIDGISFWNQILTGKESARTELLHNIDPIWKTYAYRKGDYKLIYGQYDNGNFDNWYPTPESSQFDRTVKCNDSSNFCSGKNKFCLFNIRTDPCEQNNVFDEHPDIVKDLSERLKNYSKTMLPVGNLPSTTLADPARYEYIWMPWEDYHLPGLHQC